MSESNSTLDLKPCPLCHGTDVGYTPSDGKYYGGVTCAECGLSLSNNITGWERNKHIAVERWNRRLNG